MTAAAAAPAFTHSDFIVPSNDEDDALAFDADDVLEQKKLACR
jgi:hypothetical protein